MSMSNLKKEEKGTKQKHQALTSKNRWRDQTEHGDRKTALLQI